MSYQQDNPDDYGDRDPGKLNKENWNTDGHEHNTPKKREPKVRIFRFLPIERINTANFVSLSKLIF